MKIFSIKNNILTAISFTLLLFLFFGIVFVAQSSQFNVGQIITVENPPEAPENLEAVAVSSSQVDLTWDTAVAGDLPVSGYKIYRDDILIDTTSDLFYSDTGLNPETLYTYKVLAFDTSGAESPLSLPASATTFPLDEEDDEEGSVGRGGSATIFIKVLNFSVEPDLYQAVIRLKTNISTRILLSWGLTPDYEIGRLVSGVFQEDHSILLPDLLSSTRYFFRIEISDYLGRKVVLDNQSFETLSSLEIPFNVSNLRVFPERDNLVLVWKNPSIGFDLIRIIKSEKFFPRDPFDGELVYEGRGEKFTDKEVEFGRDYFYTVFVKDKNGLYSSGALARGRLLKDGEIAPEPFAGVIDLPPSQIDPNFLALGLKDFDFIQDGNLAKFEGENTVVIKGDRMLKVSLPYHKVPEVLKTISVALTHPTDPSLVFSFLLRVNENRDVYEANIAPIGEDGVFGLHVAVLDHKNRGLKKISGILRSVLPFSPLVFPQFPWAPVFFWFFLLLLTLTATIWIWRQKSIATVTLTTAEAHRNL